MIPPRNQAAVGQTRPSHFCLFGFRSGQTLQPYVIVAARGEAACIGANGVDAIIAGFALQASARFWDRQIPRAHTQQRPAADSLQPCQSFSQSRSWHAIWLFEANV